MERQRAEARKAWAGSGETATEAVGMRSRSASARPSFLGYDSEKSVGVVTALIRDGAQTDWLRTGERGAVIVNQTPFYGKSGGQVGDIGELRAKARVFASRPRKELGDIIVHEGVVEEGEIALGQTLELASITRVGWPRAPIIRRRIFCTRRLRQWSATMFSRRAPWYAGSPALRLHASQADDRRRVGRGRASRQ